MNDTYTSHRPLTLAYKIDYLIFLLVKSLSIAGNVLLDILYLLLISRLNYKILFIHKFKRNSNSISCSASYDSMYSFDRFNQ